ncbi:MAG: fibrobacter succinogenes major paralogous domain-containing protein [Fibromonadaceae bacterium]|jgi:uncharacterized protein (TIGR02145 family)|nr:fibrobacter succinogenes major paralogous domain-containing protein [Fibromonadaceae bacterium]
MKTSINQSSLPIAVAAIALLCTVAFAQQKGTFTDSRDKKVYKTVKIGEQTWLAENLNYNVKGSLCYDNEPANCTKYGRLYDWEMAKKACPAGWHLPTKKEWNMLTKYVVPDCSDDDLEECGWSNNGGNLLKSKDGWDSYGREGELLGNGTDKVGFSALPGGAGDYGMDGFEFQGIGELGIWWSATEEIYIYGLIYSDGINWQQGWYYSSVRCLKN